MMTTPNADFDEFHRTRAVKTEQHQDRSVADEQYEQVDEQKQEAVVAAETIPIARQTRFQ
jgi:hypothetical protein